MWNRITTIVAEYRGTAPSGGAEDPTSGSREKEILELVQSHEGRIRQSNIAAATDSSQATISRTLTELEEERRIYRTSLGREKVVLLPTVAFELGIATET